VNERPYTVKKKDREFPVPSRDVTTKLSLGGNNDVITELFLPRGSSVSDILAGDGKLVNLFFTVKHIPMICHLPESPSFSLPTTFKYMINLREGCRGQVQQPPEGLQAAPSQQVQQAGGGLTRTHNSTILLLLLPFNEHCK